jgi:hypothetical protein
MTHRSALDGQQLAAKGPARDEALKRRDCAVREALGMGAKPTPNTERPAEQTAGDQFNEPLAATMVGAGGKALTQG